MTGSSFSVATTAFISLAICAIISYGVFYYFKQRLSLIEQSQMEQARIMQAIISRGLLQQPPPQAQSAQQPELQSHKEITITQNSLIEVSSDEEESGTDSESESSDTESGSGSGSGSDTESESDKWSVGDEIHQPDSLHESFNELSQKKQIHIDAVDGSGIEQLEIETLDCKHAEDNTKKIISLKSALNDDDDDEESEDEDADDSSESEEKPQDFEVKIGYKSASATATATATKAAAVHLNYGNMSVPALRQLAKERGLGGDEGDLQKLKKKELVQLLQ